MQCVVRILNLSSLFSKLAELQKFCPDWKIAPVCKQFLTSLLGHPSRMNHFPLSNWEELYEHDSVTNSIEGKENKCFLDTINLYQPDVIELNGKKKV